MNIHPRPVRTDALRRARKPGHGGLYMNNYATVVILEYLPVGDYAPFGALFVTLG